MLFQDYCWSELSCWTQTTCHHITWVWINVSFDEVINKCSLLFPFYQVGHDVFMCLSEDVDCSGIIVVCQRKVVLDLLKISLSFPLNMFLLVASTWMHRSLSYILLHSLNHLVCKILSSSSKYLCFWGNFRNVKHVRIPKVIWEMKQFLYN